MDRSIFWIMMDSRLRGNDKMGSGNDKMGSGNDRERGNITFALLEIATLPLVACNNME